MEKKKTLEEAAEQESLQDSDTESDRDAREQTVS